jgi:hypothetical protein
MSFSCLAPTAFGEIGEVCGIEVGKNGLNRLRQPAHLKYMPVALQ